MPFLRGSNRRALPASPVPKLLGTNIPPTAEHAELIRKLVHGILKDVQRHFPDHLKLSLSDTDIPAEARKLLGFARQHTRLLSSILIFPDEILEQIFFWALLTNPDSEDIPQHARPRRISHVCQRWYAVATSSPILWCEIGEIRIPQKPQLPKRREAQRLEQIETHLRRSQPHPISFEFIGTVATSTGHREAMDAILSRLVQHSERWKVVGLTVPAQLFSILEPVRNHLPLLQRLSLDFPFGERGNPVDFDYFLDAPSLRVVKTKHSGRQSPALFPLRQLTEMRNELLRPSGDAPVSLIDIISLCPNLKIVVSYVSGMTSPAQHLVLQLPPHQSLKHLCIVMDGGISILLRLLFLPSLVELTVQCLKDRHTTFPKDILQLILNSKCRLTLLDIRSGAAWPHGVLHDILEQCHFIRYLTVDCLVPIDDFHPLLPWYPANLSDFPRGIIRVPAVAPYLRSLRIWTDPTIFADAMAFSLLMSYRALLYSSSPTQRLQVRLETGRPLSGHDRALQRGEPDTMELLADLNHLPPFSDSDPCERSIQHWRDLMMKQQRKHSSVRFLGFHRMLKDMETLDITHRRAKLFYRADIPYLLSKTSASFSLLGDKIFEERATALLRKWRHELGRPRNPLGEWIFRDEKTIEFIHYHDERRRSDSWILM